MTLTSKQYKFLKIIHKNGATESVLEKHFPDFRYDPEFYDSDFQNCFFRDGDTFYILVNGQKAYESKKNEIFYHRTPLILSIAALIVSSLAIVLSPFFTAFFTKLYGLM